MVDESLARLGRHRHIQVTLPYFLAAPMIVASSKLILTGPKRLLHFMAERAPLRVFAPPAELKLPSMKWGLLWHPRMHADEGHAWFRKRVAESL